MAGKDTQLLKIAKAYLGVSTFAVLGGETIMLWGRHLGWWEGDGLSVALAGVALPTIPAVIGLSARLAELTASPRRPGPGNYARAIPLSANGQELGDLFLSALPWRVKSEGRTIRYKEPAPRPPFEFWERGMPTVIPDDRLYSFCAMAWRRQQRVKFGSLTANQIFSRPYFTTDARPRFPFQEYQSVMHILVTRNLLRGRWAGKGGELRFSPGLTVEEARRRWGLPQAA